MMNENQDEILDSEFRQILYIIKPHIGHINNHYNLERYRIWLERLSSAHPKEKWERNKYLLVLANQIHDNVLDIPFTYNPPKTFLPPLENVLRANRQSSVQPIQQKDPEKISDHFFHKNSEEVKWPYLAHYRSVEKEVKPKPEARQKGSNNSISLPKKKSKLRTCRPFQKIGKIGDGTSFKSETSSWCDLTDTTDTGTFPAEGDHSNKKVLKIERKVSPKKQIKKKCEQKLNDIREGSFNMKDFVCDEDRNRYKSTEQELETLRMRMRDLIQVKIALQDTHCLTQSRRRTMEDLELKLQRLQQQNTELDSLLDDQKKKFLELDTVKSKELNDFKEQFSKLRQKEIEYLKKYHKEEMSSLEKSHSSKISELESKIGSLKNEYEEKIKQMRDSSITLIKQKEEEIQQLRSELEIKTSQASNEVNEEQIVHLKRCISKLDKVLHKNEKEYAKKIEKLKQELELKDMTSQMKMQTQRADLIVRTASTKQETLKNALDSLEGKYRKMIESLKNHALDAKKHDDQLIEELRTLLLKNNINLDDISF